jgi:hypothetical protein
MTNSKHEKRTLKSKSPISLIIWGALTILLAACHPYGDSANDLGIHDSSVTQGGLVGTWVTANGNMISIAQDSTFSDSACPKTGQIMSVSRHDNCPNDSASCGSLTFSGAPYNQTTGCSSSGQSVCMFSVANSSSQQSALTMDCFDSNSSFKLTYQKM